MTNNERFDQILERIERAKKRKEHGSNEGYRLRVILAERQLGLGHLEVAEDAIKRAENLVLAAEIRQLAF